MPATSPPRPEDVARPMATPGLPKPLRSRPWAAPTGTPLTTVLPNNTPDSAALHPGYACRSLGEPAAHSSNADTARHAATAVPRRSGPCPRPIRQVVANPAGDAIPGSTARGRGPLLRHTNRRNPGCGCLNLGHASPRSGTGRRSPLACHHGKPARHRFQQRQAHALAHGGQQQNVKLPVQRRKPSCGG